MAMKAYKNVDSYIRDFSPIIQVRLQKIRRAIKKLMPKAEETISYKVPTYKLNGKYVVYFAAFKDHISLFPASDAMIAYAKELKPYRVSKGTVSFSFDKPIPMSLVQKFIRYRIKENRLSKK
jgi:uncharacterized protein YdhG (YjbR/CyaY superfamily)